MNVPHEMDEDAVCIHCGADLCEEYHLRVTSMPPHAREPAPEWVKHCEDRAAKLRAKP